MSRRLQVLAMLAVLAGQVAVAGQAFGLPDCHSTSSGDVSHADIGHASQPMHTDTDATDCHCLPSMHCGHCAASVGMVDGYETRSPDTDGYASRYTSDTALAHKNSLERPPSISRS